MRSIMSLMPRLALDRETEPSVVVPVSRGSRAGTGRARTPPGRRPKKASCSLSTVSGGSSPSGAGAARSTPRSRARTRRPKCRRRSSRPRRSRRPGYAGDGEALADVAARACAARAATQRSAAAWCSRAGRGRPFLRAGGTVERGADLDLVPVDRDVGRRGRVGLGQVLRVGRAEVEAASRHLQRPAEVAASCAEPVRRAGERTWRPLVGQADDARRPMRRPAVVADGPCFEHGDRPSVARGDRQSARRSGRRR